MSKGKWESATSNLKDHSNQSEQIYKDFLHGLEEMKVDYKIRHQVFKSRRLETNHKKRSRGSGLG